MLVVHHGFCFVVTFFGGEKWDINAFNIMYVLLLGDGLLPLSASCSVTDKKANRDYALIPWNFDMIRACHLFPFLPFFLWKVRLLLANLKGAVVA